MNVITLLAGLLIGLWMNELPNIIKKYRTYRQDRLYSRSFDLSKLKLYRV